MRSVRLEAKLSHPHGSESMAATLETRFNRAAS